MDLSIPGSTNSPLSTAPVFADNVQDLLGTGTLQVNPSATIVVNSIDDAVNSSPGVTTLRDAINLANADSGEDLIVFDRSLFSTAQTITLNLGELDITHSLDIIAPRDTLTGGDLVTVSGNQASRVFEIEKEATVTLSGLIVADGKVTNNDGGGIKNSGTLTLDSIIVRNNTSNFVTIPGVRASANGGGIYNNANLTVNNSTISGNSAGFSGGGIYNNLGTSTVNNSTISGNSANSGGGISNSGTSTVNNSTISGNSARQSGGGISNFNIGTLTVNNSTISGNKTMAAFIGPFLLLSGGGGINNSGGTSTVNNSTISGNSATGVGGGINNLNNTSTVNNSTISGNSATFEGGGIFSGNTNGSFSFPFGTPARVTVTGSTISGNSATQGGGIYNNIGTSTVNNSTISGNSATRDGGGIYNNLGTSTVNNSTISGNSATRDGGGIYNFGLSTVNNSTISGNSVRISGGGIYNSGTSTVNNSTISGNSATQNGGGIYNDYRGRVTLLFSTVTQNLAVNGGGVYQDDVRPFSSAIRGSFNVRNTIIASNLNSENGINPDISGTFTSNGYNLIGDGTGSAGFGEATWDIVGTSDWPIDPRLAPLDFYGGFTQTIALLPDSPAIGAADPIILDTDPITDGRGLPRRAADGSADIGAFQLS